MKESIGIIKFLRYVSLSVVVVFGFITIVGTGGGGGGDSSTPPPTVQEGTFEDSIVEGLEYETATQSGITDPNGIFNYMNGETITFSIGDIVLGQALTKEWMTPIDLVNGAVDATNPTVTNIARFLLTLDDDDNPYNGISIIESVREDALGRSVDFSLSIADFENDPDVQQVVDSLTALTSAGQRDLVSSNYAQDHLGELYPSVDLETVTVSIGGTQTITISGGKSPYTVSSDDTSVATALVNGNIVTVTGVAEGPATVTITDSNSNSVTVAVTVTSCEVTCYMTNCNTAGWGISCESGLLTVSQRCIRQNFYYPGTSIVRCYITRCSGTLTYADSGNTYDFDVEYDWCDCQVTVEVDGVGTCSD